MNKNQAFLLFILFITLPLIWFFVPQVEPGSLATLDGVTLSNMNGQKFKFTSQFSEKPILLAFWSVTCGTCIEEIPFLTDLHNNYADRLSIVAIHPPGYPKKQIQRFLHAHKKIPYMLAIDDDMTILKSFNVSVLPRTTLINRHGKVLYDHLGYDPDSQEEIKNAILSKL